jgi:hypothetical protein
LWQSKCGLWHFKYYYVKKCFIVWNICMFCVYIRCYRRLCGTEYLEICVMYSPVDVFYFVIFSLLLLWSGGWLRWIRSYYGALEQKYSVLRHCTGNTVEYLPATLLWGSSTESLLSADRRQTNDIFTCMHQFQCLVITSDSTQSTIMHKKNYLYWWHPVVIRKQQIGSRKRQSQGSTSSTSKWKVAYLF